MKILQLSFNSAKTFKNGLYGVTAYTLATYTLLRQLGTTHLILFAPTVFYAKNRPQESYFALHKSGKCEKIQDNVYIKYFTLKDLLRYLLLYIKIREFYSPLYFIYKNIDAPISHVERYNILVFEFFSLINAIKNSNKLKIYRPHEIYYSYRGGSPLVEKLEREALKLADIILPPSNEDVRTLIEKYDIERDKIYPLPIPVETITLEALKIKEYDNKEKLNAIFSGFPHKYNIEAVEFIIKNAKDVPFVTFHIFGSFNPRSFKKVPENVVFHGFASKEEYNKALLNADLAVMPLKHWTGINVRIVEYLKYGLPIVGTPYVGRGYELKPDVHFLSFKNRDEFQKALELAKRGDLRKNIVTSAIKHINDNLNIEILGKRLRKIVNKFIQILR